MCRPPAARCDPSGLLNDKKPTPTDKPASPAGTPVANDRAMTTMQIAVGTRPIFGNVTRLDENRQPHIERVQVGVETIYQTIEVPESVRQAVDSFERTGARYAPERGGRSLIDEAEESFGSGVSLGDDGAYNCTEAAIAAQAEIPGSSVVILQNSDGTGHAVVRLPDGEGFYDPSAQLNGRDPFFTELPAGTQIVGELDEEEIQGIMTAAADGDVSDAELRALGLSAEDIRAATTAANQEGVSGTTPLMDPALAPTFETAAAWLDQNYAQWVVPGDTGATMSNLLGMESLPIPGGTIDLGPNTNPAQERMVFLSYYFSSDRPGFFGGGMNSFATFNPSIANFQAVPSTNAPPPWGGINPYMWDGQSDNNLGHTWSGVTLGMNAAWLSDIEIGIPIVDMSSAMEALALGHEQWPDGALISPNSSLGWQTFVGTITRIFGADITRPVELIAEGWDPAYGWGVPGNDNAYNGDTIAFVESFIGQYVAEGEGIVDFGNSRMDARATIYGMAFGYMVEQGMLDSLDEIQLYWDTNFRGYTVDPNGGSPIPANLDDSGYPRPLTGPSHYPPDPSDTSTVWY